MNPITRRHFLKSSSASLGLLGAMLGAPSSPLQRQLQAQSANGRDKKLIFIFQRGGNDGLNTIIPQGDPLYSPSTRPTLYIPDDEAIDLGNGFAQFHPGLEPMMEIYNRRSLTGVDGPGNLAAIHRVGYAGQSRSHFSSQQYWENGVPGNDGLEEGMLYRLLAATHDLEGEEPLLAAGISRNQLVSLKGRSAIPNFLRARDFRFRGNQQQSRKFLGLNPGTDGSLGSGLLGLYGDAPDYAGKPYREMVHQTGQLVGATMETVQAAAARGTYQPANGAVYPGGGFGNKLQEAAMLLKRTNVKVLGMDIGGWDTHERQGQVTGQHRNLLNQIAMGFQAISRDFADSWDDMLVVTMTEFGRTSRENNSRGTDHAEATTMFMAGGSVRGGVYNCDAASWESRAIFSVRDRYLSHRTDFRAIFAEIFEKHFGLSEETIAEVIPGYEVAMEDDPRSFRSLNTLRG